MARGATAQDLTPVSIAVQNRATLALLYWAEQRGDFERESLQPSLQPYDADVAARVSDGDIDLLAGGAEVLLQADADNLDLRGVLVLGYSLQADAILARPDIRDVADLRGAAVAIVADDSASASELLLADALQQRGLSLARVELSRLPEEQALEAITSGEIDAVVAGQPALGRIERSAAATSGTLSRIAEPARQPGLLSDLVIGDERWLRDNKETVKQVIRVWNRVIRAQRRDPAAAAAAVADILQTTPELASTALEGMQLFDSENNIEILRGDYQKAFAAMSVVLERRGQTSARGVPSANRYLDLAPLRQVVRGR